MRPDGPSSAAMLHIRKRLVWGAFDPCLNMRPALPFFQLAVRHRTPHLWEAWRSAGRANYVGFNVEQNANLYRKCGKLNNLPRISLRVFGLNVALAPVHFLVGLTVTALLPQASRRLFFRKGGEKSLAALYVAPAHAATRRCPDLRVNLKTDLKRAQKGSGTILEWIKRMSSRCGA